MNQKEGNCQYNVDPLNASQVSLMIISYLNMSTFLCDTAESSYLFGLI